MSWQRMQTYWESSRICEFLHGSRLPNFYYLQALAFRCPFVYKIKWALQNQASKIMYTRAILVAVVY